MLKRDVFWRCPNCALPLALNKTGYTCGNGHAFDRAKQGYCNFLLPNQKNSKSPGDDMGMIDARRRFLEAGHYDFLVGNIIHLVEKHLDLDSSADFNVCDLGCGEGYYLNNLYQSVEKHVSLHLKGYGIDISKFANRRAAVKYKNIEFVVASTYSIPVLNESSNIALSVFSPFSGDEVARILKDDGIFIRVSPGPEHLIQIKEKLYETAKKHECPDVEPPFKLVEQVACKSRLKLGASAEIRDLLGMTPLNWSGSSEAKESLLLSSSLEVDADFIIQVLKRR